MTPDTMQQQKVLQKLTLDGKSDFSVPRAVEEEFSVAQKDAPFKFTGTTTNSLAPRSHVNKTEVPTSIPSKRKASSIAEAEEQDQEIYDLIGALDDSSFPFPSPSSSNPDPDLEISKGSAFARSSGISSFPFTDLTSIGYSSYAEFCAHWEHAMFTPSDSNVGIEDPVLASLADIPCLELKWEDFSVPPPVKMRGRRNFACGLEEEEEFEAERQEPPRKKVRRQGGLACGSTLEKAGKEAVVVGGVENGIRELTILDIMLEIRAGVEMRLGDYPFFA